MTSIMLVTGTISVLLLSRCGDKEKGVVAVPIGFLASATITPSSSTMNRGDTLWLEANFSDSLVDRVNGVKYRIRPEDLAFRSAIVYNGLRGIGKELVGIAPSFRVVEKIGRASIGGNFTGPLVPAYDGSFYRFRIGLIPTQPGVRWSS